MEKNNGNAYKKWDEQWNFVDTKIECRLNIVFLSINVIEKFTMQA